MDLARKAVYLCALALLLPMLAAGTASAGLPDTVAMVKDIKPGGAGSDSIPPLGGQRFAVVGDTVYFAADDGTHGRELWRSDGTEGGTAMVEDINANGSDGSDPSWLANVGGKLYFSANDGTHGQELWTSDGSAGGTDMVEDIWTGTGNPSTPAGITAMGGVAYFAATDSPGSRKLWRSDGTAAGTDPVVSSGGPQGATDMQVIGGSMYFVADSGNELWKTDGSEGGTDLVKDVNDVGSGSGIESLTPAGGTIFFVFGISGNDRVLWKTDGTPGNASVVPGQPADLNPTNLAAIGSSVLFAGYDAPGFGGLGTELWRSDGSGVAMVEDISPGGTQSLPSELVNIGGVVYMLAADSDAQEPWRSDGTAAGTFQLKNINSSGPSYAGHFTDFGGKVMFTAGDGGVSNYELWRSDGTGPGTSQVGDINPSSGSSFPNYLIKLGPQLLFGADDGSHGFELWRAVDTIAPQTTIDSGPAEGQTVTDAMPTFGFSSDDNPATFECRVDGGAFASCTSPNKTAPLAEGAHSFEVRARDAAANVDATPAVRHFTFKAAPAGGGGGATDTQPPAAMLTAANSQKLGKFVRLTVSCPDEACVATATGDVNVPGAAKRLKLGPSTMSIAKGGRAKLALAVAKKSAKVIRKALRSRKQVSASVKVVVTDTAGNGRTLKKKIKLKR